MLQEALSALQVEGIKPKFLSSSRYASHSLSYQSLNHTGRVGLVWAEESNMTSFCSVMEACHKSAKDNLCQTLYLIRSESVGKPNNRGYKLYAEIFTGSPHPHINRSYCTAAEVFSKTFIAQELSVKHYFSLANGTQQLVQGRFDSLVYDFEKHRLCVVEYKTYQSVDPSAQLAQVALYSYMLREKVGLPINSAIYCVLPDLQELTFYWEQLENFDASSRPLAIEVPKALK